MTLGLPPENLTRVPLAGVCNPSRPSSTPALVRDSLYFVILATSSAEGTKSAPAFSYPFGITSIMNRGIVPASFAFEVRHRAHPGSMDASNESFRNRHAAGGCDERAGALRIRHPRPAARAIRKNPAPTTTTPVARA